jgi:glucokinase
MAKTIGVVLSHRVSVALVDDHRIQGPLRSFPNDDDDNEAGLVELPTESLVRTICEEVMAVVGDNPGTSGISAVGISLPGIVKHGVVEDSPNIPQLKGARIAELLSAELRVSGLDCYVHVLNDADAVAAGLAAATGKLDQLIRVWTLGIGIGYGRYPFAEGVWEGGHSVVSLEDKEKYCGCGGRGHIEGIMGHRAMRLRFLDMEPEEVFATARQIGTGKESARTKQNIARCRDFVHLWHKALAAGISTCIHQDGAGKFLITGFNARFVDLGLLKEYIHQMVKMSPLQGYTIEIVEDNADTRIIGSAVAAEQASKAC